MHRTFVNTIRGLNCHNSNQTILAWVNFDSFSNGPLCNRSQCPEVATKFREPEGQVARWLERLAEFDIKVEHCPRAQHTNADALSRQSCGQCGQAFGEEPRNGPAFVALVSLFPQWKQEEILAIQQSDPDLKQTIEWLETKPCPLNAHWIKGTP